MGFGVIMIFGAVRKMKENNSKSSNKSCLQSAEWKSNLKVTR